MLQPLLIGAVAGARSLAPLAAVSVAAARGTLPEDNGAPALLGKPAFAVGALALAAGELLADKLPSAPDRIVLPGMVARLVTGALSGAALAPKDRRLPAATLGAAAALASAYLTFRVRTRSMKRYGQTATGLAEDAAVIAASWLIVSGVKRNSAAA